MSVLTNDNNVVSDEIEKSYLLSSDNFIKLKSIQKAVEEETHVIPTFKKIINLLFKDDVLDDVKMQLIEKLK